MDTQCRAIWTALALGPHPSRQALLRVKQPLAELESCWSRREAFAGWPKAAGVADLLRIIGRHLDRLERRGARPLLAHDEAYPLALVGWRCAPAIIFCWGEIDAAVPRVAVVGSRAASAAALEASRELARHLASAGVCVLSGGAIGVDGAAHEGALAARGRTIAVLGSGLDHLYPERHTDLFARIVATRGAVLSPFAPWAPPRRWQFPRRNEVMVRLVSAVVVVAAARSSGALVTAELARAAGVPVLARQGSEGADRLLGQGAGLVIGADDVLGVLRGQPIRRLAVEPDEPDAIGVLGELRRSGALSVDELAMTLGWGVSRTVVALMRLQLAALVSQVPGGRFAVLARER